jgi:hypothetical protein
MSDLPLLYAFEVCQDSAKISFGRFFKIFFAFVQVRGLWPCENALNDLAKIFRKNFFINNVFYYRARGREYKCSI